MNTGTNPLTFTKVLIGISKTLGVAREVIPLWQQTKPLVKNVRNAYGLIKSSNNKKSKSDTNQAKIKKITKEKTIISKNNSPQFFI